MFCFFKFFYLVFIFYLFFYFVFKSVRNFHRKKIERFYIQYFIYSNSDKDLLFVVFTCIFQAVSECLP